jgi:6-pyruvoyltetrahydropterin/6-carboxytetrahydropterin synthase
MTKVWTIDKQFDFCYGHRVHNQNLNSDFTGSEGTCLKCRHIHGHQGKVKVFLERIGSLQSGMVTDFKHLSWFKDFLDDELDHKFIMDINDPLLPHETPELMKKDSKNELDYSLLIRRSEGHFVPDFWSGLFTADKMNLATIEKYEGLVLVDFVPTSEMLCTWFLDVVQEKMVDLGVFVRAVEFWETPKSHCRIENRKSFL